jgi:ribosomal protein S18 acetylase RimI-like enzyme
VSGPLVRPFGDDDLDWAVRAVDEGLGGRFQARRGVLVDALDRPGLVAEHGGERVGLLTYDPDGWELVLLVATLRRAGVGRALVGEFLDTARRAHASRAWVVTTGNNAGALALYEGLGFSVTEVRRGAVDAARGTLKPSIPPVDDRGAPISDEVELTIDLG